MNPVGLGQLRVPTRQMPVTTENCGSCGLTMGEGDPSLEESGYLVTTSFHSPIFIVDKLSGRSGICPHIRPQEFR